MHSPAERIASKRPRVGRGRELAGRQGARPCGEHDAEQRCAEQCRIDAQNASHDESDDAIAVEITARSDSGAIVDSGEKTLPWSETTQLHNELQALAGGGGGGGFTGADRATLNSTQDNTESLLSNWANYISVTLPSLDEVLQVIKSNTESTFRSLLGTQIVPLGSLFNVITQDQFLEASLSNGVTCDRVDVDVSFSGLTGVNLRIDSYPEGWVFRTPDAAWSFRDLAVLSFWRSGGFFAP